MTTMIDTDTYRPCLDPMNAPADAPVEPGTPGTSKHASTEPAFTINTEERANWLLRKLANLDAERARVKAQAAQMIAQIEADANGLRARFDAELEAFARQTLEAKGGRRKSLPLLQGTLAFRTSPASVKISDEAAALSYAEKRAAFKGNPDKTGPAKFPNCAPLTPVLDADTYRTAAAAYFEQTGELLPGLDFTPARETFKIKFGKGAEEGG